MNAFSFLVEAANRWPNEPALICTRGTVTFADLLRQAEETALALRSAGIRNGMGVGLVARNGAPFISGLFGILGAGGVAMPISHFLKEQEFSRVLDLVPVSAILDDGSLRHEVRTATRFSTGPFTLSVRSKDFSSPVACGVPDAAVVRFTSGTTGSSKGVVLSHASVEARTRAAIEGLGLVAGDRVTWVLPMAYHFIVSILTYVRYGVAAVLPSDGMPQAIFDGVDQYGSSLLYASPLIVQMLSADQSGRMLPRSMKVISTSSSLSAHQKALFFERYGVSVHEVYGLIEIGLPIGDLNCEKSMGDSIGRALPGYDVAILSEDGDIVSDGSVGRLAVRGEGMFDAYLAPFRPRSEVLENGWFLTGDLATKSESGEITVRGREKSVINTAGNKVFPEEVEGVLNAFPGVKSSRAFGIPHPMTGEVVAAEILPQPSHTIDLEALRRYCYERLSTYKVPKQLSIVQALPLTDSGKVVRAA